MTRTFEIGFANKQQSVRELTQRVNTMEVLDAQSYAVLGGKINEIRELEKELEAEYKEHPVIIEAKRLQKIKGDLAKLLEESRKSAKSKLIAFDESEEKKRRQEEERIRQEAQKQADAEALEAAEALEKEGKKDEAEAVIADLPIVPTVILPKSMPKVEGHKTRTVWSVSIQDKKKLFDFVAANRQFEGFFIPNETALRQFAHSTEGAQVPGVIFTPKKV